MKSKIILFSALVVISQFGWATTLYATSIEEQLYADAGKGGPPSIYYDQYFNRGDKLKKSYREHTGSESYEEYSKRFREENIKEP